MQLYAYRKGGGITQASRSTKGENHYCIECGEVVRVRGGGGRQSHFYHLNPPKGCRLSQKSLPHLMAQKRIQSLFPGEDCQLEHHFPKISRIADVVNHPRKLVFEVQCSPISSEEVVARNRDYGGLGYQVVWILHDQRFNQKRLSGAEEVLRLAPHYFTNIDKFGKGVIYDQLFSVEGGFRQRSFGFFLVDLRSKFLFSEELLRGRELILPIRELKRRMERGCYFGGDPLEIYLAGKGESRELSSPFYQLYLAEREMRERGNCREEVLKDLFIGRGKKILSKGVKVFYNLLLEESCRS